MKIADSSFDSQYYARSIGRLIREPGDDAAAYGRAREASPHDVLFLRLVEDDPLRAAIERDGTRPLDTLVTSTLRSRALQGRPITGIEITHHERVDDADADAIVKITNESITTSHLHVDPRLPLAQTHALYGTWVRNDVTGRAQRTIVARKGGEVVGYIAVLDRDAHVVIDLVAVRRDLQGCGIGTAMIASFITWLANRDVTATVGTQRENPALALYRRCGFEPSETHVTYHLWRP